ncbi:MULTISPECIES: Na+/H+ antiporter [Actinosynnema]|uniref:Na+/H+ antiporter n=1 Tax=Actinosynnema TaxID=40566 RepID=UPI0020A38617|nr:Na+/H+ antiporter [Actinosynnema pretiosum]MCP2096467.1 monovalent cation:H+ antiporter, CPA1 family [Actinosynnema pretiosum]
MGDSHALIVLVSVGAAVVALHLLARRLRLSPPIVLLVGGALAALIPWLDPIRLPPEVVLLLFLPALLHWEALNTSLREIRANLRSIALSSVVLVLVTAASVAAVGHALGLSWPVAFVLGAVVAPTDATAVGAVAGRMPHRQLTLLRAESLVNDGTALVLFAIAVAVATGREEFSWPSALGDFGLSYAGGVVVGLLVGLLVTWLRKVVVEPLPEAGISVLTPFTAFLLAEEIHASGVLATVVCGLLVSQTGPRWFSARTRLQSRGFWQLGAFLLNGALFVLVGLQLRDAVADAHTWRALLAVVLVSATVIGVRLLFFNTVPYLVRLVDRREAQRARRMGFRERLPVAWAGFRGGVSLAAALAVPLTAQDGGAFPERELLVVVTFGVIVATTLGQGLTLPLVLRWARLGEDEARPAELLLAERTACEAGLAALDEAARGLAAPGDVVERVRGEIRRRLESLRDMGVDGAPVENPLLGDDYAALHLALLEHKRAAVVRLRDERLVDDLVLLRMQTRLDVEEVRLSAALEEELE